MTPVWSQTYSLFGQGLAVSAIIASIPILTLLLLLGVMRKPAWAAALAALGVTLSLAILGHHMPVSLTLSSAAYGAAFGLFPISWIVFWAIALYRVTADSGRFEIIRASIGSFTRDSRLQALLIAFAFGAFVEGAAGFGTPVAVAAAMLVGLGFTPFSASALCLLANTAPVAFGSIGIPVVTLAGITGLPLAQLSGAVGRLCFLPALIVPGYLIVTMAGWSGLCAVWPAALVAGGVFSTLQLLVSIYVGPQLTDIVSALAAMASLLLLLRFWRPAVSPDTDRPAAPAGNGQTPHEWTKMQIFTAWAPYGLLVVFVLLWGFQPIQSLLNTATRTFAWPHLHNAVQRMPPVVAKPALYGAIYNVNWLSASGTSCMLATLASALLLRMTLRSFLRLLLSVCRQLILPTVTVAAVLSVAFVMNYCGATATLGLAFASSGKLFPLFSPLLGWLGVFLTGSDTSSNALFGNLQVITAGRLGFSPMLMAAANSTGGVMGKMISLQTIAVATAATGIVPEEQARLFRFTLKHSLVLVAVVAAEVLLYAYTHS